MVFRLRKIETTAHGREIARDRDIAGDSLSIGRAADNDLHLPDLALDPHHAALSREADGRLSISALGTLGFTLDGQTMRDGTIEPGIGGELGFGHYRVTVGRDTDGAVLLTIEDALPVESAQDHGPRSFSLGGLLPGKRVLSWLFALAILVAFLAVPIVGNLLRGPVAVADRTDHVPGDAAWSTGPLSLAHRTLGNRCDACHVKPFEAVRDQTCRSCHKDVTDHARPGRLADARGNGAPGDRALREVAHLFGKPGPGACTDCHSEHEGAGRMEPPAQAFCAECHLALRQRLPGTRLGDASDFGKLHPGFHAMVPLTEGSDRLARVPLAGNPREASGLTFPHALHLNRRGGVAQMAARIGRARGYGDDGLSCKDCHRETADGVRFLPIDMERDCETCHSLAYDRVGDTFRRLHHGDVDQMVADLSVAPASSRALVSGRQRPGIYSGGGPYSARFTPATSGIGLPAVALSRDGICGECHTATASGGRFSVLPVTQVTRFMPHGWFSHRAHRQEKCTTCHAADRSRTSADLLLPDIQTCRTCHRGEDARGAKVPSGCAMCHSYHLTAQAPRGIQPANRR